RKTSKEVTRDGQTFFEPYEIEYRTIGYYEAGNPKPAQPDAPSKGPFVVRVSTGILAERAIKRVDPVYPPGVSEKGEVIVEVTVGEDGNVMSAVGITGSPALVEAALNAVRQWKFNPTKLSGKPVRVIGRIVFKFNH